MIFEELERVGLGRDIRGFTANVAFMKVGQLVERELLEVLYVLRGREGCRGSELGLQSAHSLFVDKSFWLELESAVTAARLLRGAGWVPT